MDKKRILEIFEDLLMIHSPSKNEIKVAEYIIDFANRIGAKVYLDKSYDKYGGNAPSIFVQLGEGNGYTLSSHMDVVEPNKDLKIIKEENIWKTDGTTTLGGDDKAGVASVLYILEEIARDIKKYKRVTAIFTPCEEMGLLGAKNINWLDVPQKFKEDKDMIVLDNGGRAGKIAYQAPSAMVFNVKIIGKKAHAGIEPEKGINAIFLASKIISDLNVGRIDEFTTMNISKIHSDFPSNVVSDECTFSGEFRAHSEEKLNEVKSSIENAIKKVSEKYEYNFELKYPALKLKDEKLLDLMAEEYKKLNVDVKKEIIGGGSDANYFSKEDYNAIIVGVGMEKIHTTEEYLMLDEMYKTTEAILNLLKK